MRMVVRRPAWAVLLVLLIGRVAAAQDVTVNGTVTTHADGLSVPGAVVSVVGGEAAATTDAGGRYTLEVPRSLVRGDRIQVKVEALGLPPKITTVVVDAPTLTVDVALNLGFTEQVTVGSRAVGAEAEKAVPVDVITQEQIAS